MRGAILLSCAIVLEVIATTLLKVSNGFTIFLPSLGVVIGYGFSFYFLSLSLKTIPLSLAYAIWSGVGTALTAIVGIVVWNEVLTVVKIIGILLIIGGVVILNFSPQQETKKEEVGS